jgi:hypothetical protein
LAATNGTNAWAITGANAGTLNTTTTFSAISNLTGGSGADNFNLNAGVTGSINGGAGNDALTIVSSFTAPSATMTVNNVESISNGGAAVLTATNLAITGVNSLNLSTAALGALSVTGPGATVNVTNTGSLDLLNINVGTGSVTLNSSGAITDSTAQTVTAQTIALTAGTNIGTLANPILTATSNLTATAGSGINIDNTGAATLVGATSTTGSIVIRNAGALGVTGAVSASGGNVSLVTTSGNLTLGSNITASGALTATGASGVSLTSGNLTGTTVGISATGGNISVTGGTSTASGGTTLTSSGAVSLQNFDSSGGALTISNGGIFTIAGPLSLHSNLIQSGAGGVVLSDNLVTNGHNAQFASAVTVASGVNAAISSGGGSVSFAKAISGADATAALSLNSGSGGITLHGANTLSNLALNSSGQVALSGSYSIGKLTTSALSGKIVIAGNTDITTNDTAIDLSPASGVDGATSGGQSLAIDTGSAAITLPAVGQTTPLASLTLNGGTLNIGNIKTTGAQAYNGAIRVGGTLDSSAGNISMTGSLSLTKDSTISAGGATGISVNGSVNGAKALTLDAASGAVDLQGSVGNSTTLKSLTINSKSASVGNVTTSGSQTYGTKLTLRGGTLTSGIGALNFDGTVAVGAATTLLADSMGFNGGDGSVTGNAVFTILPITNGSSVTVGGTGTGLHVNGTAFDGYNGEVDIGAVRNGLGINTPVVGDVIVNGDMTLSNTATLLLAGTGNVTLTSGKLSAGTVILVGGSQTSAIQNPGVSSTSVSGSTIVLVAGGQIGQSGQEVNVLIPANASGGALVQIGTGASQTFLNNPEFIPTLGGGDIASQIASDLGLTIQSNIQVTNSGQQSAANSQTGGLLQSGFIDVSVFQNISLYDVNGAGIALPSDQCEDQNSSGCSASQQ